VVPVDTPAMASLVDVTRSAFTGGLFRDDTRGGEGFGITLVADAVCCAAPPFFVLRTMMVLWFVRVLDSKNKLLRFCTTIFRHGKIFTPVPTGKKHFVRL
jgi:hypothetical protein